MRRIIVPTYGSFTTNVIMFYLCPTKSPTLVLNQKSMADCPCVTVYKEFRDSL